MHNPHRGPHTKQYLARRLQIDPNDQGILRLRQDALTDKQVKVPLSQGVPFMNVTFLKASVRHVTPVALPFILCAAAHAANPNIDLTGVTDVMKTIQTSALLMGAILALISLVFAIFSFVGGNILRGVTGVFGVLLGAGIIGWGPTWIASLTGQNVN
jgi:hypothetical protein